MLMTNLSVCDHCGMRHTSRKAVIQHLANSGCTGSAICYCGKKCTREDASEHMLACKYYGPIGCTLCPDRLFKSLDKANNHAWSAHGGGRWTPEILDTVDFKMVAQCNTRFDHMQISQLLERARNNTLKRTILKELIKESNFAGTNSKFMQMVDHFGRNRIVPLFSRTQGRLHNVNIQLADGELTVRVNVMDKDFNELWTRLAPVVIFKAQGWFNIDVNHHVDPAMNNLADQLTEILKGLNVEVPTIVRIVSFCCKMIAMFSSKFTPGVVAPLVIDAIITCGTPLDVAQKAWSIVKDHFAVVTQLFRGKMFAQSAGIDPISSCTTVLAVMAGAILMKQIPKESEIADCVSGVTKLGSFVRGATFAWSGLEKLITYILHKIFEWQTGLPAETKELELYMEGISTWFTEIQTLVGLGTADKIARDSALCAHLETLYRQGLMYSQKAVESKAPRDILAPFNVHWATLRTLYEKATASGAFRTGPRIEPVVIYLHGTSGVGKSGMVWPLATDLLRVDGIPTNADGVKDPTLEIYMRNVEQEYWDGYRNQRVCVYDDFAQIVDSVGNPNPEFMEIIRTGNLAPYPLHMATIEEKSKTYFTSRVILCTSNVSVERIRPESIACREAVRRRFDLVGEVVVRPRYRRRGNDGQFYLDRARVARLTGSPYPSLDVYAIYLKDPLTGALLSPNPITYDEFRDLAVAKYQERFTQSTHLHDFLRAYAAREEEVQEEEPTPEEDEEQPPMVAQILTQEEEIAWMEDKTLEVKLCSLQDMSKWNAEQILSFVDIFPQLKHLIHTDSVLAFDEFVLADHPGTWDDLVAEWNALICDLECVWQDGAASSLRILASHDALIRYSLEHIVMGIQKKSIVANRSLVARLKEESKGWLQKVKDFRDLVLAKVKEHPYLTIGIAVVPIVALFLRSYLKPKTVVCIGEPLDFTHEGLTLGQRVEHKHVCLFCTRVYEHAHVIKDAKESVQYPQLCGDCDRKGVVVRIAMRDSEIGYEVISGNKMIFRPEPKLTMNVELTASGDIVTKKPASLRTELTSSGDVVTKKPQSLRTELTGSGDARTKKPVTLRTELTGSGDCRTRKVANLRTENSIDEFEGDDYLPVSEQTIEAQLLSDPNALQVSKKILNNMYNLDVKNKNGEWGARIKTCFIVGRTALTAGHLIPHLQEGTHVRLSNKNVREGHIIPIEKLKWVKVSGKTETKDQMLIEFPSSVHDHADIRNSIASSAEMTKFSTVNGCLIAPSDDVVLMRYGTVRSVDRTVQYSDMSLKDAKYSIRKSYQYNLETKDGDCGAILMGVHSGLARKILGIHVAGTIGLGMASPLNIEDIERALKEISLGAQISLELEPLLREVRPDDVVKIPEGDFVPVGKALYTVASPTKTALRESLVHGVVTEPNTAPSALKKVNVDGVLLDPMQIGLKKAGKIPPSIDKEKLKVCLNDVKRVVNTVPEPDHCRVLTDEEAVAGIEGDPFVAPINRKSSPGYPYTKFKAGKPGKTKWLGDIEYKLDPEIKEEMRIVIENAKKNKRTPTIWTDTLKDERRPIAKVRAGKTRVFAAGPMVYTLVFRKYFLGFAAHCAKNRIDNEISVGTNVYSMDWTRTAERLCSKGNKVIAGDFANFDGTLVLEILAEIVEIVNDHYNDGEENAQIRRVLWKEIVNSVHVCGDDVYLWTHSQPSGCPITSILNSLYNSISMRYVWMSVMPAEFLTMQAFNNHVAMVSFGDDNCVGISDSVIDHFNQLTIADGYSEIGMTYTDETKTGEMVPYRSIHDIAYLKRKFVWNEEEHQWVAPLDIDVVLEMINWVRGDFDLEQKTTENMQTSAFELSLHGRETFEHWIPKYEAASRSFQTRPLFLTYNEYRLVDAKKYGMLAAACN